MMKAKRNKLSPQKMTRILVVMRLEDMFRVHPQMDSSHVCSKCLEPVGIYPYGQKLLKRYKDLKIVCNICSVPMPNPILAPGAVAEAFESVPRTYRHKWDD